MRAFNFPLNKFFALITAAFCILRGIAYCVPAVNISGSLETLGILSSNVSTMSRQNSSSWRNAQNRLTLNLDLGLYNDVAVNFSFVKNSRYWGDNADSLSDISEGVRLQQAYIDISEISDSFHLKVGRQFYGEEGSYLIYFGPKRLYDGLPVTSLDAAVVIYTNEYAGKTIMMEMLYGKTQENDLESDIDTSVWGFKTILDLYEGFKPVLGVYNLRHGEGRFNNEGRNLWAFNLAVSGSAGYLHYNFDGTLNSGSSALRTDLPKVKHRGYAFRAGLSLPFTLGEISFTPRMGIDYGSGDKDGSSGKKRFVPVNGDYRAGYIFSDPNIFYEIGGQLANLMVIKGGISAAINQKISFSADYYSYRLNELISDAHNGHRFLGHEFNITATYKHSPSVSFGLFYARFMPGSAVKFVNENNSRPTAGADKTGSFLNINF